MSGTGKEEELEEPKGDKVLDMGCGPRLWEA